MDGHLLGPEMIFVLLFTICTLGCILGYGLSGVSGVKEAIGEPEPYVKHSCSGLPRLVAVRSIVDDELLAGLCLGCGAQVTVKEYTMWGDTPAPDPRKPSGVEWNVAPGSVWGITVDDVAVNLKAVFNGLYASEIEDAKLDEDKGPGART